MRLLVTRPQPDAAGTAAKLVALGHEALVAPLLTIAFNDPPDDIARPGAILITSQNAVRALTRWPQAGAWRSVPVFATGPATARALAAAGFADVRGGAGDAASLADVVIGDLPRDAGPLLYPAARDRTGALADRLAASGYDILTVEAYRAESAARLGAPARAALAEGALDGILLYSGRTARTLLALAAAEGLSDALPRPRYFVISDHVADILRALGAKVSVARRPDEDSLIALIPAAG